MSTAEHWTAALQRVRETARLMRACEHAETELVHDLRILRRHGLTWEQIGAEFGLTKQGAQQRWGRALRQTPPRHH